MPKTPFVLACFLLAQVAGLTGEPLLAAKRKLSPCGKPPEMVSHAPPSKEDQEKAKRIRAQGTIAIEIAEDGNVVDAKVVHASSDEAGRLLVEAAKGMKFKSRPGCGPFKTTVNFNLSE